MGVKIEDSNWGYNKQLSRLKAKAKELENTKYEPYTTIELMNWAGVDSNNKDNISEARDKAEDSWLRFIRNNERELRKYLYSLLLTDKREEQAITRASQWLHNNSRLNKRSRSRKTLIVKAKIDCIVIEEMRKVKEMNKASV